MIGRKRSGLRRGAANRGQPGRPSAARIQAINQALLSAARAEFYRSGYESARVDTIAAAAGISKATLYDRYPTKAALLRAVVSEGVTAWLASWEPDTDPSSSNVRQRLKFRARKLMQWYCSGELELLEQLFSSGPSMRELRRMRHEVGHKRIIDVMAKDIVNASSRRLLPTRAATQMAEMLMATLAGWWHAQRELGVAKIEDALPFADHAVDVLFDGRPAWNRAGSVR